LTILTVICHIHVNDNEGKTFLRTIDRIAEYLKCERALYKPVAPFENIWHGLSDEDIDNKIKTIEELKNDISSAVDSESLNRATIILREVFGERFPRKEKKKEEKIDEYTSGAKPWGT
jgi:hypothetical protein